MRTAISNLPLTSTAHFCCCYCVVFSSHTFFYFWLLHAGIEPKRWFNFIFGGAVTVVCCVAVSLCSFLPSLHSLAQCSSPFVRFHSPSSRCNHMSFTYTYKFSSFFSFFLFLHCISVLRSFPSLFNVNIWWCLTCNVKNHKIRQFGYLDLPYYSMTWAAIKRMCVSVPVCKYFDRFFLSINMSHTLLGFKVPFFNVSICSKNCWCFGWFACVCR